MKKLIFYILFCLSAFSAYSQARQWLLPLPSEPGGVANTWSFQTQEHLYLIRHATNFNFPVLNRWDGEKWETPIAVDSMWLIEQLDEKDDTIVAIAIDYYSKQHLKYYDGKVWRKLPQKQDSNYQVNNQYMGFSAVKFYQGNLYFMHYKVANEGKLVRYNFYDSSFTVVNTFKVSYRQDWYNDYPLNKVKLYINNDRLYVAGMYDFVDGEASEGIGYTDGKQFKKLRIFKDGLAQNFAGVKQLDGNRFVVERIINQGNDFKSTRLFIMENDSITREITGNLYKTFHSTRGLAFIANNYYDIIQVNGKIWFWDVHDKNPFQEYDETNNTWNSIPYSTWDGDGYYFKGKHHLFSFETYLPYKLVNAKSCFVVDSAFMLSGFAYLDLDNNCQKTTADSAYNNQIIYLGNSSHISGVSTGFGGYYEIPAIPGTYKISPGRKNLMVNTCQADSMVVDTGQNYKRNIALTFSPPYHNTPDAVVQFQTGLIRRGGFVSVRMYISNDGKKPIILTPELSFSPKLKYIKLSVSPSDSTNTMLRFPQMSVDYFHKKFIDVQFYLHPDSAAVNDSFVFLAELITPETEVTETNNIIRISERVRGPYDPNYIIANPEYEIYHSPQTVNYTVHFQNLGGDTAFRVVVRDTLPEIFDISSLNVLSHSGDQMKVKISDNRLEFIFDDIQLTPKQVNETKSQGYVVFQVALKNPLLTGKSISNSASIYFDYESGIRTNTATISRLASAGTENSEISLINRVYPNPVNDELQIAPSENVNVLSVELTDLKGSVLIPGQIAENRYSLNGFPAGMYIIQITTDRGSWSQLIIKK